MHPYPYDLFWGNRHHLAGSLRLGANKRTALGRVQPHGLITSKIGMLLTKHAVTKSQINHSEMPHSRIGHIA